MIEFLYSALHSTYGIVISTDDVERLRQQLYAARREIKDEDLKNLSLVPSPTNEDHLWIVNRHQV